jgi:phospholipid transport system substrate-binding protein
MKLFTLMLALLLVVAPCTQAATDEDVVRSTTSAILDQLNQNRARLQKDPQVIQQLVNSMLVPHFDFDRMGQLVLGTYWEDLDADAQACFIEGYRNLLVERYAYILLSYDNHSIRYEPSREIGELGYRHVRQIISRTGGMPVSVDYAMEESGDSWKVVDLVIDSVSLIRNYRGMYQSQIHLHGLDYFISNFQGCGNEHIVQ